MIFNTSCDKYVCMRLRGFVGWFYWSLRHEVKEETGPSQGMYHGWGRTRSIIRSPCITDSTELFIPRLRERHRTNPRVWTNQGDSAFCCCQLHVCQRSNIMQPFTYCSAKVKPEHYRHKWWWSGDLFQSQSVHSIKFPLDHSHKHWIHNWYQGVWKITCKHALA